jgi:hypothetical protein
MARNIHRTWFFRIVGKNLYLYQKKSGDTTMMYPDENITNGLMFEGSAFIYPFVTVDPNELVGDTNPSLVEPSTVDEDSHINLSRMLSLAVVDYVKAMLSDARGDLERKEYYMREFWKKLGDHQSNKMKSNKVVTTYPYAIK